MIDLTEFKFTRVQLETVGDFSYITYEIQPRLIQEPLLVAGLLPGTELIINGRQAEVVQLVGPHITKSDPPQQVYSLLARVCTYHRPILTVEGTIKFYEDPKGPRVAVMMFGHLEATDIRQVWNDPDGEFCVYDHHGVFKLMNWCQLGVGHGHKYQVIAVEVSK